MATYRSRLEACGEFEAFDIARKAKDRIALRTVLERARFSEIEIESLVWSNGDIPEPPTKEEKKREILDDIIGRIGFAVISGCVLGGVFVYCSLELRLPESFNQRSDRLAEDYRTPEQAIFKPFFWGFGIGAIAGAITAEGFLIGILSRKWDKNEE